MISINLVAGYIRNDIFFFYLYLFIFSPPLSYDAFASTFSASRENLRWGEVDYFVDYIKNRFRDKEISILDVGCGNGRFLDSLFRHSGSSTLGGRVGEGDISYLGIDASAGMIEEAKKLHPWHAFRILDMARMEELSDVYNVVVFIASFHHLPTREQRKNVLKTTKRLLGKWGVLMMTNWNLLGGKLFGKYEKSHQGNGEFAIKIGAHKRYYHGFTVTELEDLFTWSGYSIVENRVFEEEKNIISIVMA